MTKIICCGGRTFQDYNRITLALNSLRANLGDFAVIHGGATGADELCALWAKGRGLPVIKVDANWVVHGKAAGSIRNKWMLELAPTLVVAFPGGSGTADMITKSQKAGVEVWQP